MKNNIIVTKLSERFFIFKAENLHLIWVVFVTVFVAGLFTHGLMFFGGFLNSDALYNYYSSQNMVTSGRWFLTIACAPSSYYNLPLVIGGFCLLYLSLTSLCIVEFFELGNSFACVAVSVLIVTFMSVTNTIVYLFTADGYFLAFFLSALAVVMIRRFKLGFIMAAVLVSLSMGIYQSYLSVSLLFIIFLIVTDIIMGKFSLKRKIKEDIKNTLPEISGMPFALGGLFTAGMGMGLYYVILEICLKIQGVELSGYQGIGSKISLSTILSQPRVIFSYFKANTLAIIVPSKSQRLSIILLMLCFAYFMLNTIYKNYKKGGGKFYLLHLALLPVLAALVPICADFVILLSPNVYYHNIMRIGRVVLFIFPVCFCFIGYRYLNAKKQSVLTTLIFAVSILCCLVIASKYMIVANIAYKNMEKREQKQYAYFLRLIDRIEQTPGYNREIPIAIIPSKNSNNFPDTSIGADYNIATWVGANGDFISTNSNIFRVYMAYELGVTVSIATATNVEMMEIFDDLDSFPDYNCVKIVDGVLYVKTF